ncbi:MULTISPECIES: hypothetical protein [unclassified Actinoplanes]|uniref:hypothetical protein n=1 Tax=unclassified Actinoplanes TaxID=2626549 RepID=UPI0012BA9270|nr:MULTISPECIES: hypothetical protein [unclassified Actinoplanes]
MKIFAVLAVGAVLLGGCAHAVKPAPVVSSAPADNGVAALPAEQIVQRAQAALKAAPSFRVRGSLYPDGSRFGRDAGKGRLWQLDMRLSGTDRAGWTAQGQSRQDELVVGGKRYLRSSLEILAQQMRRADAEKLLAGLGGHWVTLRPDEDVYGDFVTRTFLDGLLTGGTTLTKGTTQVLNGVPAIAVQSGGTTLYVATTGAAYPLKLSWKFQALSFSEFGATFPEIQAPPPADVIVLPDN